MEQISIPKVEGVVLKKHGFPAPTSSPALIGTLHLTPHHAIFSADAETWISHSVLHSVHLHPPDQSTDFQTPLVLRTRLFDNYTLYFPKRDDARAVYNSIEALISTRIDASQLYAYCHAANSDLPDAWDVYDMHKEYQRMGVFDSPTSPARTSAFRLSNANKEYAFCPTYPAQLVVPVKISDVTLGYAKSYRSKSRIPSLVYLHWANLGTITRCSQPLVGIKNNRSIQDEKLVEAFFSSHQFHSRPQAPPHRGLFNSQPATPPPPSFYGATATNLIVDARPFTNAMANVAKGGGSENMEHYRNCKKVFLGIDNIHVMRDSLSKLSDVLRDAEMTGTVDQAALRRSGWLKHLSAVLEGAVLIARNIHLANSHALLRCSDGWDRTSQLSSLSQLLLDPYYRTIKGFAVLIEKDWLSYGHKFQERVGHLVRDRTAFVATSDKDELEKEGFIASVQRNLPSFSSHAFKETSPVFNQFLDCVWQIMRQYPDRFEFDERLLLTIHEHLFSCQYGTFLFDTEHDRLTSAKSKTRSIWELFLSPTEQDKWLNSLYDPLKDDPKSRSPDADLGVLFPNPKDIRFWPSLFKRTDEELNGVAPVVESHDVVAIKEPIEEELAVDAAASVESPATRFRAAATPAVQGAAKSLMSFGGSAWKSMRQGYNEVMRDYNAQNSMSENSVEQTALPVQEMKSLHISQESEITSNPWAVSEKKEEKPETSADLKGAKVVIEQSRAGLDPLGVEH